MPKVPLFMPDAVARVQYERSAETEAMQLDPTDAKVQTAAAAVQTNLQNHTSRTFSHSHSSQSSVDSDDEFSPSDDGLPIFSSTSRFRPEATTVACQKSSGKVKNVKGSDLIEIVHGVVQVVYGQFIDTVCDRNAGFPLVDADRMLTIRSGSDWLMTMGGWKGMAPSEEVKDYYFFIKEPILRLVGIEIYGMDLPSLRKQCQKQNEIPKFESVRMFDTGAIFFIQKDGGRLHISPHFKIRNFDVTTSWHKDNEKRWVSGYRTDLSYSQLVRAVEEIHRIFQLDDAALASLQLCTLNSEPYQDRSGTWSKISLQDQMKITQFLHFMNALMFGIEASGLNAALAISLMTLDLISNKKLTYKLAFNANQDGGIYPYANLGFNRGTFNAREEVLTRKTTYLNSVSFKEFRDDPSLSPVALKEAIIIKYWLAFKNVTSSEFDYNIQIDRIEAAVRELVYRYFDHFADT